MASIFLATNKVYLPFFLRDEILNRFHVLEAGRETYFGRSLAKPFNSTNTIYIANKSSSKDQITPDTKSTLSSCSTTMLPVRQTFRPLSTAERSLKAPPMLRSRFLVSAAPSTDFRVLPDALREAKTTESFSGRNAI